MVVRAFEVFNHITTVNRPSINQCLISRLNFWPVDTCSSIKKNILDDVWRLLYITGLMQLYIVWYFKAQFRFVTSVIKKGYNKTDEVLLGGRDTLICYLSPLWTQYDKFIFHIIKTRCFSYHSDVGIFALNQNTIIIIV